MEGHFGAKPPTNDARLACCLLGGVEKQADIGPAALCECGNVSSRSFEFGRPFLGADEGGCEEGIDGDKVDGFVEGVG